MTITRAALAAELAATHDLDETAAAEAVTVYAGQLGASGGDLADEDANHVRRALESHLVHDTGRSLDVVADTTEHLRALRATTVEAEQSWRTSIRAALTDGQRVVDIADAAGISRERVYQIRDDRR